MVWFLDMLLVHPMLSILLFFDHLVNDFGLALTLLACLTSFITWLDRLREIKRSETMRLLAPHIERLQQRYHYQSEAYRHEVRELYREFGISRLPLELIWSGGNLLITIGLLLALQALQGASLLTVNGGLYAFLPHFATLPDLHFNWLAALGPEWHFSLVYPFPNRLFPVLIGLAAGASSYSLAQFSGRSATATISSWVANQIVYAETVPLSTGCFNGLIKSLLWGGVIWLLAGLVPAGVAFYYLVNLIMDVPIQLSLLRVSNRMKSF